MTEPTTTNHYLSDPCPHCGGRVIAWRGGCRCEGCEAELQPAEVWSRPIGYLRPTSHWNKGKVQEWKERVTYDWRVAVQEANRE